MTRIIAGQARGRRLKVPRGDRVRPTTDRVRESVFAALGSLGALDGATVLDAFAGSGALGLEALSRGAVHATFVERHRPAAAVLGANVAALGFEGRSRVVRGDVLGWLAAHPSESFDVAFCDPPHDFAAAVWDRLLGRLNARILVAESDRAVVTHAAWSVISERRWGSTVVQMARRRETGTCESPARPPEEA
ncbi:MAG: 16S rRNA (guanine(966)-N(2))-methyltransferase RsmD [bacterium]|nr:16S rRNA (guanine(966)-N(2))-methyltransferase RsmD [bacterium]MCY3925296.1 16S rRNA (guanine(966)-N(2))-methyltransferase RsmD [bacterium]